MSNLDLNKIKFKKKMLGGVDKLDVLKKLKSINQEYQTLLQYKEIEYIQIIKQKEKRILELEIEIQRLKEKAILSGENNSDE